MKRPCYRDLPGGDARKVFGADDVFGCLNLLTQERVLAATRLAKTGQVFSLNAAIGEWPNPSPLRKESRPPPKHVVFKIADYCYDDYLDGFYPQASSQWDHFLHVGDMHCHHFYNDMDHGGPGAGMGAWAERGIVGRGVLLDVARWRATVGRPIDWRTSEPITDSDLKECANAQRVEITEGTILIVRTGWESGYRPLSQAERERLYENPKGPGLAPTTAVAELLWDWGVAAVAADNPALEQWPPKPHEAPVLHELVMARLGIPFGEFWLVDALAQQCSSEKRYEFLVTSAPLNIPRGVGSTANVLAIL